jgi:hypothetical protein
VRHAGGAIVAAGTPLHISGPANCPISNEAMISIRNCLLAGDSSSPLAEPDDPSLSSSVGLQNNRLRPVASKTRADR